MIVGGCQDWNNEGEGEGEGDGDAAAKGERRCVFMLV